MNNSSESTTGRSWLWPSESAALVVFVMTVAFGLRAANVITADTWFNLRFGQKIVREGLPRINDDTLLALGAPWVDLQWLAHVAWYAVYASAGVMGVVLVRAALMVATLAGPHWTDARRSLRPALVVLLACIVAIPFGAARAQSFAEPLFVLSLLVLERAPSTKARWALLGIALLWANLHGSAPLLCVLIVWRAIVRARHWDRRTLVVELVVAVLCAAALLATPYGASGISHYRGTLGNPLLRARVVEWSVATPSLTPWYFAVALVVLVTVVRARAWRFDAFGVGLAALTMALGFWSVRYQIWFALVFARYGAGWLDVALGERVLPFRVRGGRWTRALPWVGVASAVAGAAYAQRTWADPRFELVKVVLVEASQRGERLYVDLAHVDRLLLQERRLRRKLPYDIRFELWKARDFWEHRAREKNYSPESLARWDAWDVVFLERPEDFTPVLRGLAASGRWRFLPLGTTGTLLRRAALPPDPGRTWIDGAEFSRGVLQTTGL